jgi:MFS family permease
MTGIALWRLGESLNDVTTEAIVPDLVPAKQFGIASAIKAASFVAGGLMGYIALYFMAAVHYTWCYYAYLGCMFITAIPSLMLLNKDLPAKPNKYREGNTFGENMSQAYITPTYMEGGFPEISLAIFVMSCGTAPMFFFLLIIRDLLGVHNEVSLAKDFAIGSTLFFLGATIATAIDVIWGGRTGPQTRASSDDSSMSLEEKHAQAKEWEAEKIKRLRVLVWLSGAFAISVVILPLCQFLPTLTERFEVFYPLTLIFGLTFGLGYSRFQDATWRVLPEDCDMSNTMGFNVMARNFGLGVGNFGFGTLLEAFKVYHPPKVLSLHTTTTTTIVQSLTDAQQVYTPTGYDVMCIGCFFCNITAGWLTWRLKNKLQKQNMLDGLETPQRQNSPEVSS